MSEPTERIDQPGAAAFPGGAEHSGMGGMSTEVSPEIQRYVAQVRVALADLPPALRDELLEDLPEHLAEVAAEGSGPLVDRIGQPAAYAAELRVAAGLGTPKPGVNLDQRIAQVIGRQRDRLHRLDAWLGPIVGHERISEFLRLLRPAWWLLRGYLAAMLVAVLLTDGGIGLLPRIGHSTLAALLLLAVTVTGSVWLGRRTDRLGRRPRLLLNLGAVVLVMFGLAGFLEVDNRPTWQEFGYHDVSTDQYSSVQDVYVYDREGRLLEDVLLFDQNGEPIRLGSPWCPEAEQQLEVTTGYVDPIRQPYPFCPDRAPFRFDGPRSATPSAPTGDPAPTGSPTPTDSPAPAGSPTLTGGPTPTGGPTSTGSPAPTSGS